MPQKEKQPVAEAAPAQKSILFKEKERYQSKGFGLVFACLQVVAFYYLWPVAIKHIWVWWLGMMEKH